MFDLDAQFFLAGVQIFAEGRKCLMVKRPFHPWEEAPFFFVAVESHEFLKDLCGGAEPGGTRVCGEQVFEGDVRQVMFCFYPAQGQKGGSGLEDTVERREEDLFLDALVQFEFYRGEPTQPLLFGVGTGLDQFVQELPHHSVVVFEDMEGAGLEHG